MSLNVYDDEKVSLIEIMSDSGINLSSNNPRIKHTGNGCLTIQSTSVTEPALQMTAPGGFNMDMGGKIDIDTTDNGDGINIGTHNTVPIFMGTTANLTTVNGDLTVEGNFIVNGDSVQHNITIFDSEDPLFYLNKSIAIGATNLKDIGFIGERGNQQNIGWFWSESNNEFSAVGITTNGDDSNDIITPIDNYKPIHCGGLIVETDTSNATPTICNVNINGQINLTTTGTAKDIILTTTGSGKVDVPGKLEAGTVFQDYQPSGSALLVPTGAVMPYAGLSPPGGWLFCTGATYLVSTYPTLHSVLGYTYGGTNNFFAVPDLRSRFPLGAGAGPGLITRELGDIDGQEVITTVPPHDHNLQFGTGAGSGTNTVSVATGLNTTKTTSLAGLSLDLGNSTSNQDLNVLSVGTNIVSPSVDIMNPFLVLNYIIKV
jgi:microcystin-dependent protein